MKRLDYSPKMPVCAESDHAVELMVMPASVFTELGPSYKVAKIQIAIAHINGHFAERLRVSTIAGLIHVSSRHLNRLFQETVRMSAKEYIVRTRVRFAKLELKQMGKPLHQIAVDNGFYDQSVFTKFFRRIVGKTPLAYRRQHLSHGPFCDSDGPVALAACEVSTDMAVGRN